MSEELVIKKYRCRTCMEVFDTKSQADECESRPISQDRGVKIGDVVMITAGDGHGSTATVERIFIISMNWGHYAWKRYWHTVALETTIINGWGNRMLTFDNYEVLP